MANFWANFFLLLCSFLGEFYSPHVRSRFWNSLQGSFNKVNKVSKNKKWVIWAGLWISQNMVIWYNSLTFGSTLTFFNFEISCFAPHTNLFPSLFSLLCEKYWLYGYIIQHPWNPALKTIIYNSQIYHDKLKSGLEK